MYVSYDNSCPLGPHREREGPAPETSEVTKEVTQPRIPIASTVEKSFYPAHPSHFVKNTISEDPKSADAGQKEKADRHVAVTSAAPSSYSMPSSVEQPASSAPSAFAHPMEALLAAARIHEQSKLKKNKGSFSPRAWNGAFFVCFDFFRSA